MELRDSLILLGATAAVSGFLVPVVLKRIDLNRAAHEKDRDARRSRRDKLVEAQASFLERLTEKLWKWRYLLVRVTYYGGTADERGCQHARETYAEQFWPILNDIRVEISRSRRLVSEPILEEMQAFYDRIVGLDRELLSIAAMGDEVERNITYMDFNHKVVGEISDKIDLLLDAVANDLHLSKKSLGR